MLPCCATNNGQSIFFYIFCGNAECVWWAIEVRADHSSQHAQHCRRANIAEITMSNQIKQQRRQRQQQQQLQQRNNKVLVSDTSYVLSSKFCLARLKFLCKQPEGVYIIFSTKRANRLLIFVYWWDSSNRAQEHGVIRASDPVSLKQKARKVTLPLHRSSMALFGRSNPPQTFYVSYFRSLEASAFVRLSTLASITSLIITELRVAHNVNKLSVFDLTAGWCVFLF